MSQSNKVQISTGVYSSNGMVIYILPGTHLNTVYLKTCNKYKITNEHVVFVVI